MKVDTITKLINNLILDAKETGWSTKGISDKWHTFDELYYHYMAKNQAIQ